jgi:opacity protein-like surface antigen
MNFDCFSPGFRPQKIGSRLLPGLAFAVAMSASSGAFAQCTTSSSTQTGNIGSFLVPLLSSSAAASGAASGALAGALGNLSTAFQTQQGSAFVSAPNDPKPDQPGGGVWVRGVGGEVTNKFSTSSNANLSLNVNLNFGFFQLQLNGAAAQTQNCPGRVHESFAGVQVGQDIARLNWGGWNVHVGTTAGYLGSHAFASNGGATDYEVPFLGTYLVATHGRFFADIMVREEFYNISQTDFSVGAFGQRSDAHGVSVSTSAGYNYALPNNWFVEPSAGFIWSRTNVDTFNLGNATAFATFGLVSTVTTAPIDSEIGRLSLRVGTTLTSGNIIFQPFASASLFHEFAGNVNSTLTASIGSPGSAINITQSSANSTTRVGSYGQYSLGVAAQVANTGWLGFVRGDYRNGDNINGWTANAGLRYQFTPEAIASVMPVKAPVKAPATLIPATNWTGFYLGGFAGVAYGKTDIRFVGDPNNEGNNPRVMGALGGGEIGYNYQFVNNWVLGAEGDLGATNLKGAKTCGKGIGFDVNGATVGTGFNPSALVCENNVNWMATVAARAGYSWNRTLFYVKAGGAWADDNVSTSCIFGSNTVVGLGASPLSSCVNQAGVGTKGFSTGGTRTGWLLGFGTEFDLGHNWSAKAEYDYIDFGSRTALATDGTTTLRDSGAISQVKIGVNYHFTPQALFAKY